MGNYPEKFLKTRFFWAIEEDVDRVSTDQTMRFKKKEHCTLEWDDKGSPAFSPNGINRGNIVVMIIDTKVTFRRPSNQVSIHF